VDKAGGESARLVHAAIAAAVADPAMLASWRESSTARAAAPIALDDRNLDRLWRFSGLATKVRHNDVRLSLPLTFGLLDRLGLSIELFADYAPHAAELRQAGRNTRAQKIAAISSFLYRWLHRRHAAHARVWDVLRHEKSIYEAQSGASSNVPSHKSRTFDASAVPMRAPNVTHRRLRCDPMALAEMLRSPSFDLTQVPVGAFHFAYRWNARRRCVDVVRLDETAVIVLDLVDGSSSINSIAQLCKRAGVPIDCRKLLAAIRPLAAAGLLDFRRATLRRPSTRTRRA
jgi:hypothetical protein